MNRSHRLTHRLTRRITCIAFAASLPTLAAAQTTPAPAAEEPQRIVITGQSDRSSARDSSAATGLNLSSRETPQALSVITRQTLDDFKITNVNDALNMTTGVVVEQPETDRTYFTARGFDIVNFQLDGIGTPLTWGISDGDLDSAIYERIDVLRGATGLLGGTGNPSATINFVRKRPTKALEGSAGLSLGSWNDKRVDLDVGGPLNASGSLHGRAVVAAQDKDSYLDRYHHQKGVFYGIVEADVGPGTLLAAGLTIQKNRPTAPMWGALPLYYSDGTPTELPRSTSTSVDWAYWNNDTTIVFAEATQRLGGDWTAKAVLTHKEIKDESKLLYVYGTPDKTTGDGLFAWPSTYDARQRQDIVDLRVNGPFTLLGRRHELVAGASASELRVHEKSMFGNTLYDPLPSLYDWHGNFPEPTAFDIDGDGSRFTDRLTSAFVATRLQLADGAKLILGANHTAARSSGISYSESAVKSDSRTSPYVGAVVDLSDNVSAYASHTAIFLPQTQFDQQHHRLDPATGQNLEFGLKSEWLEKKLQATLALFKARQDHLATYAGFDTTGGFSYYEGVDTKSQGVELELSGQVTPGLRLNAGYTQVRIEDGDGNPARTFTPRRVLRLATTWQPGFAPGLKLGASLGLRSRIYSEIDGGPTVRQGGYGLLDLMAGYDITPNWNLAVNLRNVTDKRYLTSLYWSQSYYAAPRNGSVSLTWKF